jgi:hypothetical protein
MHFSPRLFIDVPFAALCLSRALDAGVSLMPLSVASVFGHPVVHTTLAVFYFCGGALKSVFYLPGQISSYSYYLFLYLNL